MIRPLLLIALIFVSYSLYTPSYWAELGKDVTDGIL